MTVEEAKDILNYMIDDIKDFCDGGKHMSDESKREMEALDMAIKALEQQSPKWIPVSERLPKLGERVLCQCQSNIYEVLKLTVDGWYYNPSHCYMESFVIAWQPLPQPYTESEDKE